MKEMLTNFMGKKPRSSQFKAFSKLNKVCGAPSTTMRNITWTQLGMCMADKIAMLLVLRKQAKQ